MVNLKELVDISHSLKLLYVEDDEDLRISTLKILKNFFKEIVTAVDGQDGVEKAKAQEFDLILSDINMPKLNGIEMVKIIKEKNPNIPVLMLSAYSDSDYFVEAIELDVDGYILKPLILEQFIKILFKIVQKISLLSINEQYQKNLESEVKKRNAEIEYKLYYDSLTNLLSRYSFFEDIKNLESPVVFLIDIDEFKVINEVYGSTIGSEVLKEFASFLDNAIEDKSYKKYRLSADEFAVVHIAKHTKPNKYEIFLEQLFRQLKNLKIKIDENIISVDVTIGLSMLENNSYDTAKIALDYAKKYKKKHVVYSSEIDNRKESSLTLKCRDDISLAIDEKRVVSVFHPIVNKVGQTIKHETLMRLREKDSSNLILPYLFLDVAIKTRLYEYLSSTIIFKALNVLNETNHMLSVNFTYTDIKNEKFIQEVEDFFITHQEVGKRAVFEITESESIENYSNMKEFIKRFRRHGVQFAIDDFGSGFSNFEYILEIEPDYLKIDGSLVKNIDRDSRSYTLVKAIVEFSHKLGIKVIAEYVHSKTVFDMLKELNVDEYQGFYFSEPLEEILS